MFIQSTGISKILIYVRLEEIQFGLFVIMSDDTGIDVQQAQYI